MEAGRRANRRIATLDCGHKASENAVYLGDCGNHEDDDGYGFVNLGCLLRSTESV